MIKTGFARAMYVSMAQKERQLERKNRVPAMGEEAKKASAKALAKMRGRKGRT